MINELFGGMTDDGDKVVASEEIQGSEGTEGLIGMDAIALYPSIEKEGATRACREAAKEVDIKIINMNYLEATQFLALTMIENYLHIQYIGDIRMILRI